ncbi:MAG: NAD-binding protein, partial [Gemmatimonadetes bacterium]|nr:NAD-binding protein [Gemmatimonadota bacterium]
MQMVAVIGAGQMGNGIAHVFAQAGHPVTLIDVRAEALEQARATIASNLDRQVRKGTLSQQDRDAAIERVQTSTELAGAESADLVVEAATENPELKFGIFRELDAVAPKHAILASNTSSISITEIAAHTSRAEQVIGMH